MMMINTLNPVSTNNCLMNDTVNYWNLNITQWWVKKYDKAKVGGQFKDN